ncbi:MAG: hypothetical protein P0Y58_07620 [Candidatus Pseudomonas phytovorans]|uniref:Uncharacterized protein n=1 Tax=Candidatus Pseudomonas phytovorans TaxID=3121377 RepID=A0AAJ5WK66_9PSED|nr:hypothetical protein [Pseudomonas sp.]WEK32056.1 MAG: hypothetical protein P0Y58_07620 [Pseudomonas sp.]
MRLPFEMFHETIYALKRIVREMAMGQIKGRGAETKKGAKAPFDCDDVAGTSCWNAMWSG